MEYGRRGESLFSLAFRKREYGESLYRALKGGDCRREKLRVCAAGEELWMEPEEGGTMVAGHHMNLCGREPGLPLGWLLGLGWSAGTRSGAGRRRTAGSPEMDEGGRIRCVGLYHGRAEDPDRAEVDLSSGAGVSVTAVNIGGGRSRSLLEACPRLGEYGAFVEQVKSGLELGLGPERAAKRASRWARENHVLGDLLELGENDVRDRILREYEGELAVVREKQLSYAAGMTDGLLQGEVSGMARLLLGILSRFGPVPLWLEKTVAGERDCGRLQQWGTAASRSTTLEEFLRLSGLFGRQ